MFFWNSLAFSMIQRMLAIWSRFYIFLFLIHFATLTVIIHNPFLVSVPVGLCCGGEYISFQKQQVQHKILLYYKNLINFSIIISQLALTQNTLLLDSTLAKCLLSGVCISAGLWRHCHIAHFRALFLDLMFIRLSLYSFIDESGTSYTVFVHQVHWTRPTVGITWLY